MIQTRVATVLATVICLAACGGGSGGGSDAVPVVFGPAPTPAPSPTPTPSPTPMPLSYGSPNDFSRDFDFSSSLGYSIDDFIPPFGEKGYLPIDSYLLDADRIVRIAYTAQPETIRFSFGQREATVSYTGSERSSASYDRNYRNTNGYLIIGNSGRKSTYLAQILYSVILGDDTINGVAGSRRFARFGLVGPTTNPNDALPLNLNYRGAAMFFGGPTEAQITNSIDDNAYFGSAQDSNEFSGNVAVREFVNDVPRYTTLIANGTIDRRTGIATGTLANVEKNFTGTFRGQLFGPQGLELGVIFKARRESDGLVVVGDFIGAR